LPPLLLLLSQPRHLLLLLLLLLQLQPPQLLPSLQKVKTRLLPKPTQRLLRLLPRPLPQLSNLWFDDDNDGTTVEDLDLHNGYRRPEVADSDVPLPDYILKRLRQARLLALAVYDTKWG
jgi:hypothetical protein